MPVRYFNVDPVLTGLGYGFNSFMEARARKQAENAARTAARKAQQKKIAMIGGGAVAGLGIGLLAAPALGAIGALGTPAGGLVSGMSVPLAGGYTVAGLGGAAIGATAGGMFAEGDYAGGIGQIAQGVAAPIMRQQARREGMADYSMKEGIQLANALTLGKANQAGSLANAKEMEALTTEGNIRQMRADPRNAYLVAEQDREAAIQGYRDSVSAGPQAGQTIGSYGPVTGPEAFSPITARGPAGDWSTGGGEMPGGMGPPSPATAPDLPGPSDTPGMERVWTTGARQDLAKLDQRRRETVDNPEWMNASPLEKQAAEWQALARKRQSIHTTLVQSEPKPMFTNQQGQQVPMQLGTNYGQDGSVSVMDIGAGGRPNVTWYAPPSKGPAYKPAQTPYEDEVYQSTHVSNYAEKKKAGWTFITQPDGKIDHVAPPKDDGEKEMSYGDYAKLHGYDELDKEGEKTGKKIVPTYEEYLRWKRQATGMSDVLDRQEATQVEIFNDVINLDKAMDTESVSPNEVDDLAIRVGESFGMGVPPEIVKKLFAMKTRAMEAWSGSSPGSAARPPIRISPENEAKVTALEVEVAAKEAKDKANSDAAESQRQKREERANEAEYIRGLKRKAGKPLTGHYEGIGRARRYVLDPGQ